MAPDKARGPHILLVDDNPTNLQVLYQTLDGNGYHLLAARSGKDALSIAQRVVPDLILLDVMMPELDGFETCARLKADPQTRDCAVVFLSAVTESREKVRGLELGAVDFVNKPFQAEEVLARVRTHLTIRELQQELRRRNEALQHELNVARELLRDAKDRSEGVLRGSSAAVARLRDDVEAAARSDDALLISGPPGSEHEAVARAVHHQSRRAAHAILSVDCLSLADSSSSFEKTGSRPDVFELLRLAEGGTLYLEGVQHLPKDVQRRLAERLRALEGERASAEGDSASVRVIASTTRDVDDELAAGRLMPDLRRALPTTVDVPALRSRPDDIPVLAAHMLRRLAEQSGRTAPSISDESMRRLKAYRWPGNLRQLRHVLGSSLATNQEPVLEIGPHLLEAGPRVGSYSLIEQVGSGGMGEVWLARHELLARPAAVKIIRDSAVASGDDAHAVRQRFAREAQATAELQSPHTVQLFDFGVTESGSFYYVMERLRGLDLQRMIERHGPLPVERAVYLLKQACRSLSEAHDLGLVHRDIKPANLFACRLGAEYDFLKVLDFGVVARQGADRAAPITVAGMVVGTPAYLAPELVSGDFDARADIYGLGCVAYWLVTGRPPFDARDTMSLLKQHSSLTPAPPSSVAQQPIPPEFDALVLECLSKDPALRPATAETLWERLEGVVTSAAWDHVAARRWWQQHEPAVVEPRGE